MEGGREWESSRAGVSVQVLELSGGRRLEGLKYN